MSERENELKQALAENSSFSTEKAKQITADAVSQFHAGLKKTERLMWIYLVACVAVILFAFMAFQSASSVKMMIGFGILMLAAYETTILMKLWYWTVNTKLALLKAIKQLQLQTATVHALSDTGPMEMATGFRQPGLSLWERLAWLVVLVIVAVASSFYLVYSVHIWPSNMARFEGVPVTVEAPRLGAPVYYTIYLRMDKGVCKVSRITPEHKQSELFWMGKGFVNNGTLPPGDSLRLDPQGNKGEYWVRFE
jgi:hypothetical protein